MSNDKKPKKAKPAIVHGATAASRAGELGSKLLSPAKPTGLTPAKKKK
ncbi:MAG TPA: hypothetical protein VJ570_07240 [Holophagaceae bacterium]|nr:hypothetical protein [Holophagaceae bacterium]